VRLTRRQALAGAATGALGAAGIYELVDQLTTGSPKRRPLSQAEPLKAEQHVLGGVFVVEDEGVEVIVPPLHHEIVTARVTAGTSPKALRAAQAELEQAEPLRENAYKVQLARNMIVTTLLELSA